MKSFQGFQDFHVCSITPRLRSARVNAFTDAMATSSPRGVHAAASVVGGTNKDILD